MPSMSHLEQIIVLYFYFCMESWEKNCFSLRVYKWYYIKVKIKVQVYSLISSLKTYHPTLHHWTCSFVCHFNSTGSMQSFSRFGALNLSYTLPSLFYQVLIFTWVKWSIWGWSALPKDTTSEKCPKIERRETWYFSENSAPSGIRNRMAGSDIGRAPRSNHCAMSLYIHQFKVTGGCFP